MKGEKKKQMKRESDNNWEKEEKAWKGKEKRERERERKRKLLSRSDMLFSHLNTFINWFLLAARLSKTEEMSTHKADGWILRGRITHYTNSIPIFLEYFVILAGKSQQVWLVIDTTVWKEVLQYKHTNFNEYLCRQ